MPFIGDFSQKYTCIKAGFHNSNCGTKASTSPPPLHLAIFKSRLVSRIDLPASSQGSETMEAYAKLVDKTSGDVAEVDQREYMITDLPCVLGRVRMPNCETPTIVIDTSETLISRQHAEIKWSHEAGWTLTCLSKNGLSVDNVRYKKDDEASLRDGSSIHLGKNSSVRSASLFASIGDEYLYMVSQLLCLSPRELQTHLNSSGHCCGFGCA